MYNMLQVTPIIQLEPSERYLYGCRWSPFRPLVLAASAGDGQVFIYDLNKSILHPIKAVDCCGKVRRPLIPALIPPMSPLPSSPRTHSFHPLPTFPLSDVNALPPTSLIPVHPSFHSTPILLFLGPVSPSLLVSPSPVSNTISFHTIPGLTTLPPLAQCCPSLHTLSTSCCSPVCLLLLACLLSVIPSSNLSRLTSPDSIPFPWKRDQVLSCLGLVCLSFA